MTHLRKMMLEELQRRNYSAETTRGYLGAVAEFAKYLGNRPTNSGPTTSALFRRISSKNASLLWVQSSGALLPTRFFFIRTLKRHDLRQDLPYPKKQRKLPSILSLEEVGKLIDAVGNLKQRAILMILYGTGMRRAEVAHLKISYVDSKRIIIRVENSKGAMTAICR